MEKIKLDKKKPKFLRRGWYKKSRLGRHRKKKQTWRAPKGRHNKMRQKWKGYAKQPSIGYSATRETRGRINGLKPVVINNINELMNVKKDELAFIASTVGTKKKIDIANKAKQERIKLGNLDIEQFLAEIERIRQEKSKKKESKHVSAQKKQEKQERQEKQKQDKKEIKQETKAEPKQEIKTEQKPELKQEVNNQNNNQGESEVRQ